MHINTILSKLKYIYSHLFPCLFFVGKGVLFYLEYIRIDNNRHLWLCLLYAKDYAKYLIILFGNSLAIQRLGLCSFTAKGLGSVPDGETKIPQATQCSQNLINKI